MIPLPVLSLIFTAACQVEPPSKPKQELDPKNPASLAEHAIHATRTQKSYETKFDAVLALPQGDPIKYKGRSVWVAPGVLYIHYTASGGDEKQIVGVGGGRQAPRVWVYHSNAEQWVDSAEMGMDGGGRGIQNPDEVLAVLSRHVAGATLTGARAVRISFSGDDIQKIMKEQARSDAFDWKDSKADVDLEVDEAFRLKKFTCAASLKSTDPKVQGVVKYTGTVEVVSYNESRELKFIDGQKPIPLSDEMQKKIAEVIKK